jgi:hypothetical protein
VVIANELLDNLPFRLVERARGGWTEVRVGLAPDGFAEVAVPASPEVAEAADDVAAGATIPTGARLPVPTATTTGLTMRIFAPRLPRRRRRCHTAAPPPPARKTSGLHLPEATSAARPSPLPAQDITRPPCRRAPRERTLASAVEHHRRRAGARCGEPPTMSRLGANGAVGDLEALAARAVTEPPLSPTRRACTGLAPRRRTTGR